MTEKSDKPARVDRRAFLRGASVAAAAVPLAASAEQLKQPTNHQAPARYQESEHVKRFYALNRR
jgi:hypothetical protein